jgi:hypothetical protein
MWDGIDDPGEFIRGRLRNLEAGMNYARNVYSRMTPYGYAQGTQAYLGQAATKAAEQVTRLNLALVDVSCKIHGPMHHRPQHRTWVCHGFDGEGCEAFITEETVFRHHEDGTAQMLFPRDRPPVTVTYPDGPDTPGGGAEVDAAAPDPLSGPSVPPVTW